MKDEQREEDQHGTQDRDRFDSWTKARSLEETGGTDDVNYFEVLHRFVRSPPFT